MTQRHPSMPTRCRSPASACWSRGRRGRRRLRAEARGAGRDAVIFPAIVILPPADAARSRARRRSSRSTTSRCSSRPTPSSTASPIRSAGPRRWSRSRPVPAPRRRSRPSASTTCAFPTTTFDSEGLLALPELARRRRQARRRSFAATAAATLLGDTLRARGARVDYVACYRRARAAKPARRDWSRRFATAASTRVTITSTEGLDNLWAVVDGRDARGMRSVPTFVPHPRIAEHARELGLDAIETAGGDAGLIAGLLEWFAAQPDHGKLEPMPQPDILVTAPLPPFLYDPLKADYRCHDYHAAADKPALLAAHGGDDPRPRAGRRHGDADGAARRAAEARDHLGVRRRLRRRAGRLLPQARHQGDQHARRADRRRRRRRRRRWS